MIEGTFSVVRVLEDMGIECEVFSYGDGFIVVYVHGVLVYENLNTDISPNE